jgi:serine/threonine-protein kinase
MPLLTAPRSTRGRAIRATFVDDAPWYHRRPGVLLPGEILDRKYRVVRLLGEGGMGAVYEGQNLRVGRRVAIKVMHRSIARDREAIRRFEREAQAAARIGSRHIVDVIEAGELRDGSRYLVMEYLEGENLSARLKKVDRLPVEDVAHIGVQLLEGLAKVHEAGIVHRDLKPANVFLARREGGEELVKILDFGVCKIPKDKTTNELLTGVGDVLGTPAYMAPEQLEHGPAVVDGRADLYAVGVLLYRASAGRLPYKAKDFVELLMALREKKNPPLVEVLPDVDPRFAAIVDRAVEWDVRTRFQTARDFQKALVAFLRATSHLDEMLAEFLDDEETAEQRAIGAPAKRPASQAPPRAPMKTMPDPEAPARAAASTVVSEPRVPVAKQGAAARSRDKKQLPPVRPPPKRGAPKAHPSISDAETGRMLGAPARRKTPEVTTRSPPDVEIDIPIDVELDMDEDAETKRRPGLADERAPARRKEPR